MIFKNNKKSVKILLTNGALNFIFIFIVFYFLIRYLEKKTLLTILFVQGTRSNKVGYIKIKRLASADQLVRKVRN